MSLAFWISYAVLWLMVIGIGAILLGVLRTVYWQGGPSDAADVLGPHVAPAFRVADLDGNQFSNADIAGQLTALLFASPNCTSCMTTLEQLNALSSKVKGNVVVVCQGSREDCALLGQRHHLTQQIVVDEDAEMGRLFKISGTPTAVILDELGRIISVGHPMETEELEELIQSADPTARVEPVGVS
jgi:methylamine dehydrogenase accessory protein MauD